MIRPIRIAAAVTSCVVVFAVQPLRAAGSGQQPAVAADEVTSLSEVVVTARKREEKLQDVPISITSISAETLEKQGISDVSTLTSTIPGIEYSEQRDRNSALPGIRGVKSTEISPNRQKISTFYDGKPVLGNQSVSQFLDIDRVEVYRGPQSAQFGRAVFGGAINYISTPVNMSKFSGKVAANVGSEHVASGSVVLTGPILGDKLGFLLSATADRKGGNGLPVSSDGYDLGNTSSKYASAKLAYKPADWMTANLRYQYLKTNDGPSTIYHLDYNDPQFVLLPSSIAPNVNPLSSAKIALGEIKFSRPATAFNRLFCFNGATVVRPAQVGAVNPTALTTVFPANCVTDPHNSVDRRRTTLDLDFDLPGNSSLSVSGFHSTDHQVRMDANSRSDLVPYLNTVSRTAINPVNMEYANLNNTENFAQALWLSPGGRRLRGSVGFSYYDYDFLTLIYNNVTLLTVAQTFAEATRNRGVFGQVQFDLTSSLTLSGEARYQQEDFTSFSPVTNQGSSQTTRTFLPRYSLTYKFGPDLTAYAQVAKGNNPAGVNVDVLTPNKQAIAALAGTSASLNGFLNFTEETIWNYEVGLKGALLNRRLSFDLAVYRFDWSNFQTVTNYQIATNGSFPTVSTAASDYTTRVFYNAGKVNGKGFELSTAYQINRMYSATFAYAHVDSTYGSACSPDIVKYGLPVAKTTPSACVDTTGKSVPLIAKDAANLGLTLTLPLSNGIEWSSNLSGSYTGKQFLDDSNLTWIGAKTTANLRSSFRKGGLMATLFINNLTDDQTPSTAGAANNPFLAFANQALTGNGSNRPTGNAVAPRRYGLTVNYRF